MTPITSKWGGEQEPTSFNDVLEGIYAYLGIADDEGLPDDDVHVRLTECFTGGFEVVTGTFHNVPGVGDEPGSCEELTMYVTPDVARHLLEVGVVQYCGRYGSFEEACESLAFNALPHDPEQYVLAYDSYHPATSFEEASSLIAWYNEHATELGGTAYVSLAPVDIGYEIVAFTDAEQGILGDSDYVSDTVAQRLVDAGLAEYMEMVQ